LSIAAAEKIPGIVTNLLGALEIAASICQVTRKKESFRKTSTLRPAQECHKRAHFGEFMGFHENIMQEIFGRIA
jgi:hypothetical protein